MFDEMPKILIVDDQPSARELLEAHLGMERYELLVANNGPEALKLLETTTPDVILMDVMMPGMTGFDLCRTIKSNSQWSYIPIILVTALNSKQDLAKGLEAGADDFIHKPVNGIELRARVRSMLRIKAQHDQLEERNRNLEIALQLREDLSSMIVHDMRSPLTTIMGLGELLEMTLANETHRKDVATIAAQAHRLSRFLDDMLTLAKMEEDELILGRSMIDFNPLMKEAMTPYCVLGRPKGIKFALNLPEGSQNVWLDAHLFQRVLDNLISNALKFSPRNGEIKINLEYLSSGKENAIGPPSGPQLRVKIYDEGPGIAPEHRTNIFEKFEIVALKQKNVPQVGLGLAFCKLVVKAHGGEIWVEKNSPKGSIFIIEL